MTPEFKPQLTVNLHDRGGYIRKQWHTSYKVQHPQTLHYQYKSVNKGNTVVERYENTRKILQSLKNKLRSGWNPLVEHDPFKNTYRKRNRR